MSQAQSKMQPIPGVDPTNLLALLLHQHEAISFAHALQPRRVVSPLPSVSLLSGGMAIRSRRGCGLGAL